MGQERKKAVRRALRAKEVDEEKATPRPRCLAGLIDLPTYANMRGKSETKKGKTIKEPHGPIVPIVVGSALRYFDWFTQ